MKWASLLFAVCCLLFFASSMLHAQVRINEFLIDPPQKVELINIGSSSADISGWYIDDSGGTSFFTIPQNTIVSPNKCSVFESDFNLNKSSPDTIRLFNNAAPPTSSSAFLIDSFSYKASSGSGITFKRIPDGTGPLATGEADFGNYNNTVNSCIAQPTPSATSTPTPTPFLTPTSTPVPQFSNVYISEAMVNPNTGEREWVELYNNNEFEVVLTDWFIDDAEGGSNPKDISISLPVKNYHVVEFDTSVFNNDGDSVRLLDDSGIEKDTFSYSSSQKGESWGRTTIVSSLFCLQEPTKGFANGSCLSLGNPSSPTTSTKASFHPEPTTKTSQTDKNPVRAALNSSPKKTPSTNQKNTTTSKDYVLGESTTRPTQNKKPHLSKTLSLVSFSYSLLTIISIFFRMKTGI